MAQFDWSILVDAADLEMVLVVLEISNYNSLLEINMYRQYRTSLLYSGSVHNTDIGRFLLEF